MFHETLLAIAIKLFSLAGVPSLAHDHPIYLRADAAAHDLEVALKLLPEKDRARYGRIAYVWSFYESSFFGDPSGSNDKGSACGVMQVHDPERVIPGATCSKVRKDRRLGYLVGLRLMQILEEKCGNLKKAMNAFSTDGACHEKVITLVDNRCKIAGGCNGSAGDP